jgi:hypothetical protein
MASGFQDSRIPNTHRLTDVPVGAICPGIQIPGNPHTHRLAGRSNPSSNPRSRK